MGAVAVYIACVCVVEVNEVLREDDAVCDAIAVCVRSEGRVVKVYARVDYDNRDALTLNLGKPRVSSEGPQISGVAQVVEEDGRQRSFNGKGSPLPRPRFPRVRLIDHH